MIGGVKGFLARTFGFEAMLRYTERVSTIGCVAPLLHFAILPFGIFAYVLGDVFGSDYQSNATAETVTFVVTNKAFYGFFWLSVFWTLGIVAAFILVGMYRAIVRSYKERPIARTFAKALFAIFVTSGTVERLIANVFMPTLLDGSRLPISVAVAPPFHFSLYRDLGALVRSPMWDFGRYSLLSLYTWLPLAAFGLTLIAYLGSRIRTEIRIATKDR
ncbi:hypothetical protein HFO56_00135 [Rhizobium laguerreae]|uniref:hypothetical protein n=1 Tax=Rhizobium laguerreae TaxID=1076926 RepID=UPI001C90B6A1|nr:hypothetical protein [Rhizobium laguerreae]MBY3150836.1 hypothetical protein [Rhizobium laguerreae]